MLPKRKERKKKEKVGQLENASRLSVCNLLLPNCYPFFLLLSSSSSSSLLYYYCKVTPAGLPHIMHQNEQEKKNQPPGKKMIIQPSSSSSSSSISSASLAFSLLIFNYTSVDGSRTQHASCQCNPISFRGSCSKTHSYWFLYFSMPPKFNQLINYNVHTPNPIKSLTQTQIKCFE